MAPFKLEELVMKTFIGHLLQAALILELTLGVSVAAQSDMKVLAMVPTVTAKHPDLWIPFGKYCVFDLPTYTPSTGILSIPVGNAGKVPAPKSSLRVKEYRSEEGGPWTFHKEYWATVPALAAGQQVAVQVKVAKWSGGFNSNGKPIKHPRRWILAADGKGQVAESNENNNGFTYYTYN